MQTKDVIGMIIALVGILGGTLIATFSKRARDLFFFFMVLMAPLTESFDVNFVSRDFYRGTTRGFEFSCVDILSCSLLFSALLWPRKNQSRGYWPASFGLMLIYFAYACVNVALSDPRLFGYFELSKMIRGMVIFLAVAFYLRSERELRIFVGAIACLICYQGYVALKERVLYAMERVPGTVDDSNSLSVLLLTTMPVMVAAINSRLPRKLKLLAALAIPAGCGAMVLTLSRMGISIMALLLVVSTAVMISWKITPKKIVCAFLVLILGSGVVYKNWAGLKERFGETNMKEEYGNNRELGRGYYLREARAIIEDRFLGVGLNNWSYWVSEKYGPMLGYKFVKYRGTDVEPSDVIPPGSNVDEAQAAPAHSLAALTAGELGIPGLILFTFLWIRWFQMASVFLFKRTPDPLRRIGVGAFFGLSGIFLQSLTEWVFRHSPIFYTVHILLGVLASLYYMHRQQRKALKLRREGEAPGVSREYRDEGFPASPPAAHPA